MPGGKTQMVGGLTDMLGLSDSVGMSHQFEVHIDSGEFDLGTWSKASGLSVSWTPCHYRAGDDEDSFDVFVVPGNAKYTTIKLSRAACRDSMIVQRWLVKTAKKHEALSGEIRMVSTLLIPIVRWKLTEFYPIGWGIDNLDAGSSKAVIETLEIAHSGFLREELAGGFLGSLFG